MENEGPPTDIHAYQRRTIHQSFVLCIKVGSRIDSQEQHSCVLAYNGGVNWRTLLARDGITSFSVLGKALDEVGRLKSLCQGKCVQPELSWLL